MTMAQQKQEPKYYGLPPLLDGDVVIGLEKFSDMKWDIYPLHEAHYNETETTYLAHPFKPNYEAYFPLEEDGRFVCFTVRLGLQMVAYLQYYIFRDPHSFDVLQAREDAFYVAKGARGHHVATELLNYAELALRKLGCQYVGMTSKAPVGAPDIGPFLEKRGYNAVAVYYAKQLEE